MVLGAPAAGKWVDSGIKGLNGGLLLRNLN